MIIDRLLNFLLPARCKIVRAAGLCIAYNPRHALFIREYYLYVVALFRAALADSGLQVNVIFGNYHVDFGNRRNTLHIDIQFEHTLVKPGGRDSDGAIAGRVPLPQRDGFYLARIANYDHLHNQDCIVEYSLPNIVNVSGCAEFADYVRKLVYVAPLIYDAGFFHQRRADDRIITLFFDLEQPRRKAFLETARRHALPLHNVKNVFDKHRLQKIYERSKILVNVHQTDHHDTLEELRILPALLCGVIVISEDVPLREQVPYHRFIVWSSYAALSDTIKDVTENYARYHAQIFGNAELLGVLSKMREGNADNVLAAVTRMAGA